MTVLRHSGALRSGVGTRSGEKLHCLCPVILRFLTYRSLTFHCKENGGARHIRLCVFQGVVRLVHSLGYFSDVLIHIQSLSTVTDESAMRWVISWLTIDSTSDGSVGIMDETSLSDMIEGQVGDFSDRPATTISTAFVKADRLVITVL